MAPPPSPLRKMSNARFRSKFAVSYEALLAGEHPWLNSTSSSSLSGAATPLTSSYSTSGSSYFSPKGKKPSAPRTRFFADVLCLKVEPNTVEQLVQKISPGILMDDDEGSEGARIRDNIGSLWRECLRVWTDADSTSSNVSSPTSRYELTNHGSDEVRRSNAIDTLLVLSSSVLAKNATTQSSTSMDLIWIFAGGIDEADDVFEGLVSAIDEGLRGELDNTNHHRRQRKPSRVPSSDYNNADSQDKNAINSELPTLQELLHHRIRAVQLAIIWISNVSSTNLAAYFVRRDLFVAACSFLTSVQTLRENAARSAHMHGGLADNDEILLKTVVRNITLLIGLLAGLGQGGSTINAGGSSSSSFTPAGAANSPYFRRLCDWVDSGSMTLLRDSIAFDFDKAWRSYEAEGSPFISASNEAGPLTWTTAASIGLVTDSVKRLGLFNVDSTSNGIIASLDIPPLSCCSLLPIYLLARANPVFVQIALSNSISSDDKRKAEQGGASQQYTFASSFISLSSYLATHASHSARSKAYSRLALLTILALMSTPAGTSAILTTERNEEVTLIKQCQQRSGPISVQGAANNAGGTYGIAGYFSQFSLLNSTSVDAKNCSGLLPYIIDSCAQYLRFNLKKRLDVSGYLICIQVLKCSIDACADRKMHLEYQGWGEVWRAIQTVIAFLVGRHTELKGVEIGNLGKALLSTLSFALHESDRFLQNRREIDILLYELIRSSEGLRRIACIAVTGKDPADLAIDDNALKVAAERIVEGIPGWRLIDMVLLTFESQLQDWRDKRSSKGGFNLGGFGISSLTGGYLKGSTTLASDVKVDVQSAKMPDIDTVMQLISTIDLERLVSTVNGAAGNTRSNGIGNVKQMNKANLLDEEWLERAESQCISEAFRVASDDMRTLVAAS